MVFRDTAYSFKGIQDTLENFGWNFRDMYMDTKFPGFWGYLFKMLYDLGILFQ